MTAHDKTTTPQPAHYAVIRDAGKWRINFSGNHYGYYDSAEAATAIAIDTAQQAGEAGFDAQVMVEGLPMQFRRVWRYGDAVPPPA